MRKSYARLKQDDEDAIYEFMVKNGFDVNKVRLFEPLEAGEPQIVVSFNRDSKLDSKYAQELLEDYTQSELVVIPIRDSSEHLIALFT